MGRDGLVTVVTGVQDIGTGVTTAFAIVAAEELGLPLDRVRVEVGSTRYGVYAPVSGGSQTTPSVMPAVRAAAYDLRGKLLELAGDVFEVSPDDLRIVDGEFVSLDGALREPIIEVTGKLGKAQLVGTGSRGPNPEGCACTRSAARSRRSRSMPRPARSPSSASSPCTTSGA